MANGKYEKLITKSRYVQGLQCLKLLWVSVNAKEKIPEADGATQRRFDDGHAVGEYAKQLFPDGIDIPTDDFSGNLRQSRELLKERKPLFEAAFCPEGGRIYSRADILVPTGDKWDIVEVKSSTQVKEEHISDVAFQKYCCEKAGLKINKCFLMHLNSEYVRHGKLEVRKMFTKEDISEKVNEEIKLVPERLKEMFRIIDSPDEIKMRIGRFCGSPHECALKEQCWDFLPANSVFDLYRGGKLTQKLFDEGIIAINDIPDGYELNDKQKIQQWCGKNRKPHVNKKEIENFLKSLKYPFYFLDFETFQTTIPIYDNQRPYQQILFQFSLHVVEKNGEKRHFSFLAEGAGDPRKKFLEELKKVIGKEGSIIVYNQSFEEGRLRELAEIFKKEKKETETIIGRMADLLVPFRNFDYYDCKQQGSASIKDVLPALTGKSYEDLEIGQGGDASLQFFYSTHGMNGKLPSREEIKKIRENLLKYCQLDTQAMIWILDVLKKVVGEKP